MKLRASKSNTSLLHIQEPTVKSREANGMIIEGLKKRLYDENSKKGGKWIRVATYHLGLRT
jgi:hypothetical protein